MSSSFIVTILYIVTFISQTFFLTCFPTTMLHKFWIYDGFSESECAWNRFILIFLEALFDPLSHIDHLY